MIMDWLSAQFGRTRAFMALGFVAAACVCAVLVLFGMLLASSTAQASVSPRPNVELVKVFQCNAGFSDSIQSCGARLEGWVNEWFKEIQPNGRIVARQFTATEGIFILMIFYEVPEWRVREPKPLTEARP